MKIRLKPYLTSYGKKITYWFIHLIIVSKAVSVFIFMNTFFLSFSFILLDYRFKCLEKNTCFEQMFILTCDNYFRNQSSEYLDVFKDREIGTLPKLQLELFNF